MNLMWYKNSDFHGFPSDWKLDIVKEGIWDLPSNNRKMTSHSNFKVKFSERPLDLVRGSSFQFYVISEVWLPWVLIWLKIGHCKARNVKLAGQRRKNGVTQHLQSKIFWKVFESSYRCFISIWFSLRSLAFIGTHLIENLIL